MPSYTIRQLDSNDIASAKQRARDAGTSLDAVLRAFLTAYAQGATAQQAGGRARADALTAEERSTSARTAALARWHK